MELYITINAFCALVIIMLMFMVRRGAMHESDQKVFFDLCFHSMLLLLLDILWVFIDGRPGEFCRTMNELVNAAYFVQTGVFGYCWSRYSFFIIGRKIERRWLRVLFATPMLMVAFMGVASIWTGWFFICDADNHYLRGELFWMQVALIIVYLLISFFVAFFAIGKSRNLVVRHKLVATSALGFIPFFAELVQISYPGTAVFCAGATLSLVIVFINIQKDMISLDPLTKLNNRNQTSVFLMNRSGQGTRGKNLYVFMMDLDLFKGINDTFGHLEGDRALLMVASTLKRVCGPRGHFIARFGGDEFVVLANLALDADADELRKAIESDLAEASRALPYSLTLSIGYARMAANEDEISLFKRADAALYAVKQGRHLER